MFFPEVGLSVDSYRDPFIICSD